MSVSDPYAAPERPTVLESKPKDVEEKNESGVPSGTVKEILEWVGDDKERAQAALEAEQANADRKTLVGQLEEMLSE